VVGAEPVTVAVLPAPIAVPPEVTLSPVQPVPVIDQLLMANDV
jgi:hypothetical protein